MNKYLINIYILIKKKKKKKKKDVYNQNQFYYLWDIYNHDILKHHHNHL